jgi:hypothetical protein
VSPASSRFERAETEEQACGSLDWISKDVVVVEETGNASSVAAVIAPHVKKVVIANPKQVRIIAHAKWAPSATWREISSRWSCIALVLA